MKVNLNKVLFLVPDGVGVRNYLYSDILANLKDSTTICVWSTLPKVAFEALEQLHGIAIDYQFLAIQKQGVRSKITTESATYARLLRNAQLVKNPTILSNWNDTSANWKQYFQKKIAKGLGLWASKKYNRILWLEKVSTNSWSATAVAQLEQRLEALQPDTIFITHQRVAGLMPVCIAAKKRQIKIVTAIYSWDNLPKARLAVKADLYLVWSNYMKKEMQLYYPEIAPEKCVVTGTPQFEFYSQKNRLLSREAFAARYNLNASKKWLCFSGDDTITSPNDHLYLKDVAESIQATSLGESVEVIFRRSPADFSDRYAVVVKDYPSLIKEIDPIWKNYGTGWGSNFPQLEDVSLLVNLAFHCELVLNVGSTMAHDFGIFDKPCCYFNYNHAASPHWNVETIYNFQHFRTMANLEAVVWIISKERLALQLQEALLHPTTVAKDRIKWLQVVVQHPLETSSTDIANLLVPFKAAAK
jgi:hypothetical protein